MDVTMTSTKRRTGLKRRRIEVACAACRKKKSRVRKPALTYGVEAYMIWISSSVMVKGHHVRPAADTVLVADMKSCLSTAPETSGKGNHSKEIYLPKSEGFWCISLPKLRTAVGLARDLEKVGPRPDSMAPDNPCLRSLAPGDQIIERISGPGSSFKGIGSSNSDTVMAPSSRNYVSVVPDESAVDTLATHAFNDVPARDIGFFGNNRH